MPAAATSAVTWPAPDPSDALPRPPVSRRQCLADRLFGLGRGHLDVYDYSSSQVWLDTLAPERDPHDYDLCDRHAQRLSVPNGWNLDDRRSLPHMRLVRR